MLPSRLKLLEPLVSACLFEEIDSGRHIQSRAVSVEVSPVASRRDLREFIELPYRLHSTQDAWVPPLRIERRLFLSPRFNAFFKRGEAQLFVARRDGRVVGRVSAQVDTAFNRAHDNAWGMFGFLELENDPEAMRSLLDTAAAWLRERGRDLMIGPMDFTMNDESGVLIEGYERPGHDPPALATALLPRALRGRPAWPRPWTCSCGSSTSPAGTGCCPSSGTWPTSSSPSTGYGSAR